MSERIPPSDPADLSRRTFLGAAGGTLALSLLDPAGAAEPADKQGTHHVPADKNLDPAWVASLFARGASKVYRGDELTCTGMPVGGICAGQLYLRGDGTLASWEVFNTEQNTGYGDRCYRTYTPPAPVSQGFRVWVKPHGGEPLVRALDRTGFPNVEFVGEYPIGRIRYRRDANDPLPLDVGLEAFSPFVPLDTRESGTPGTVLRFRIQNTHTGPIDVGLGGWLQNAVCAHEAGRGRGRGRNTVVRGAGLTTLLLTAEEDAAAAGKVAPPEVFEDFESGTYGKWQKTGTAFGDAPATGTLPNQQPVTGFGGKYLVNTFRDGDRSTGTLTSPEFTVRRPYVHFRIGGGNYPGRTCLNLLVDGKVVRSATGKNQERLEWDCWEVREFQDRKAVLEIVDRETGGWGHINVDDIQFADEPPSGATPLKDRPDFGTLALSVLDDKATASTDGFDRFDRAGELDREPAAATAPLGRGRSGGLAARFTLAPGEAKEVVFLLTWHFPNAEHGRRYATWFADAVAVAGYLRANLERLTRLTHLFHDTYYDSTLPHWLLDRLLMPVSTLATNTVQWWRNGRFWAWEGVGCCHGTCTHVWNYAQAVARLFPELERSARAMQDLGVALDARTGRVMFRGDDPNFPYAADGQCGTVLKCYREHLMAKDDAFLKQHWPRIKQVMEYAIGRDGNANGVLSDRQHNTYDIDFVGPNTFVGGLYLAALEAAARMAESQGDGDFAGRCRAIAGRGRKWTVDNLWNGAYFVQRIPPGASPRFQYGDGCLADQLFGQNWANEVGLGYVYPADQVRTALQSIYRYNWAPDVAAQNRAHPPERWFARPGEAGLFTCTWPEGGRMQEPVRYRDEVWTGIEYQVAAGLLAEGMLREGLSILRGVHDRYDGRRHNPWNEVECGDHYARALASWGCLLALTGLVYDGPAGRLGFAPRWRPEDFQAFFSAAEGWGSLGQRRGERRQESTIAVKHGQVTLREVVLQPPEKVTVREARVSVGDRAVKAEFHLDDPARAVTLRLAEPIAVQAGETLTVSLRW
jgi:non-lysosomal glucosylceramidase